MFQYRALKPPNCMHMPKSAGPNARSAIYTKDMIQGRIGQLLSKLKAGRTVAPYQPSRTLRCALPGETRSTNPLTFRDTSDRVSQPRRTILSRSNQSRMPPHEANAGGIGSPTGAHRPRAHIRLSRPVVHDAAVIPLGRLRGLFCPC